MLLMDNCNIVDLLLLLLLLSPPLLSVSLPPLP